MDVDVRQTRMMGRIERMKSGQIRSDQKVSKNVESRVRLTMNGCRG